MNRTSHKWKYSGPLYYKGRIINQEFHSSTYAVSFKSARRNILYNVALHYGSKLTICDFDLDDYNLKAVLTPDEYSKEEKNHQYCQECGAMLTDSNLCPVCDLGEEDI